MGNPLKKDQDEHGIGLCPFSGFRSKCRWASHSVRRAGLHTVREALGRTFVVIEGPAVFALDGRWVTEKTTFVAMFATVSVHRRYYLRNYSHRGPPVA